MALDIDTEMSLNNLLKLRHNKKLLPQAREIMQDIRGRLNMIHVLPVARRLGYLRNIFFLLKKINN
jgi:hypothetical protein